MPRSSSSATLRKRILLLSIGTTLAATASLCLFGFFALRDSLFDAAFAELSADMAVYEEKVSAAYSGLAVDAGFLAATPDVVDALNALTAGGVTNAQRSFQARATRQRLERTFTSFLEARPHLTQVRLVERSAAAPELVRVERADGAAQVVPPEKLREEGRDPFIRASAQLGPNEWRLSDVALTRGNDRAGDGAALTLRIVYAVPDATGRTGGYVVLNASYLTLMRQAIGVVPTGASVRVETDGHVIAFTPDRPEGYLQRAPGKSPGPGHLVPAADEAPSPGKGGRTLTVIHRKTLDRGSFVTLRLSKPKAVLMADANRKLVTFLELSALLVFLASLVAVILGNRLASQLSLLAAEVTKTRSYTDPIRLGAEGFREVQVLAKAFENVFNRLVDQSRELVWRATHDQLSGLLDRRGLDEAIRRRLSKNRPVAVIQFDLDRFKLVNDTLGHEAGDAVIAAIGIRLRSICDPGDIMCRMGGDEFVVVRSGADRGALESFAAEAIPALSAPVSFNDRVCRFGTSMGAADGPYDLLVSGDLFRRADHALYRAKNEGRGRFSYFGSDMERRLRDRAVIASDLDTALEKNQFDVEYMPKVAACDGRLIGLEALVRWRHPVRGTLMPKEFLPISEELKLTQAIDEHVLKLVLKDRSRWLRYVASIPTVSVNVSARRLIDPDLVSSVRSLGIPQGAISFELLESIFLDDASEFVTWSCDTLREMGIGIEIDDFGSGHASILGITRIRPDWIKIDQALVGTIESDGGDASVLKAILDMAAAFGIKTIAEGVETETQARVLTDLGCDALQGYQIGLPIPAAQVPVLLDEYRERKDLSNGL